MGPKNGRCLWSGLARLIELTGESISLEQLRTVIHITRNFNLRYRLPMTIHLIALLSGRLDLDLIYRVVRGESKLTGTCVVHLIDGETPEMES